MKTYLNSLKATAAAEADRQRLEEAHAKRQGSDSRIKCNIPLTDQIAALMNSLPAAQRDRPWSMDELCARLKGRYAPRPHPMHVGQALRSMGGWTSKRDWTREGGGRRVWLSGGG